ncbi:MAG: HAMP domain-containing sensor histidine kinase [Oscillospiraceae bacterium]|nr:HAMP domain-containing sensor histidine kinase [Oscillospiraceae bacterium]
MKLSLKMALAIMLLLTLCLTLNGYLMIERNFKTSLETAARQNTQRHSESCYFLERESALYMAAESARQRELSGLELSSYGSRTQIADCNYSLSRAALALLEQTPPDGSAGFSVRLADSTSIYSAMPSGVSQNAQIAALSLAQNEYSLFEGAGGEIYMLMATPLAVANPEVSLVSAFSVGQPFASRSEQLRDLSFFTLCTLGAAALLTALLSGYLTRPLKRLKASSESIASGSYSERTDIKSGDEFGALSRSFDAMAEAVERNIEELKLGLKQREDFVAAFTHEIKTPMAAMLGYSSLLCSGLKDESQRETAQDYIWRETRRLEALSQKLMLLMGLKEEKLETRPVLLSELCASLLATLPESEKPVEISARGDVALPVMGDAVLLDCLLRNLVLNARNACESGTAEKARNPDTPENGGIVEINWQREGESVTVAVSDNGRGISKENLKRITEPFYMVDKSRARSENGSGLGLTLASRIAELHGGSLSFESEEGRGTRVSFRLPAAKEDDDEKL